MPLTPLTPDDIESYDAFPAAGDGYNRDAVRTFLVQAAASLRAAEQRSRPPALRNHLPAENNVHAVRDDFDAIGHEVADLLRAAHAAAENVVADAAKEATAIRDDAEHDASAMRQRGETEATALVERARRVLVVAQEQADPIVSDARAEAREIVRVARQEADRVAEDGAERLRLRAEDLLRAEHETLQRLKDLQLALAAAIDDFGDPDAHTVLDITRNRPANPHSAAAASPVDEPDRESTHDDNARPSATQIEKGAVARAIASSTTRGPAFTALRGDHERSPA